MISARPLAGLLCIALALPGCAAQAPPPANLPATPIAFREAQADAEMGLAPAAQPDGRWWKIFADPVLDGLVEHGDRESTNIQEAAARLAQAQAMVHLAAAAQWPQAGLGANASQQTGPLVNAAGGVGALFNAGANLSYEVDFLGRFSKTEEAARLDAASREALLHSARLLTQAQIAQTYFSVREVDEERALLQSTIDSYRETLRLTEGRRQAGLAPDLSVARARAELGAVESDALVLDRRRAELEHSLAFLTGETASAFHLESAAVNSPLPLVPAGIPSAVLARRPDVAATERSMEAAQLRLGVAQTAWFPSFNLTASGGFASSDLANLLTSSARSLGVGAFLALPLLDGGRRKAGIQSASADLELASDMHREQILTAFRDVEDQLSALRLLANQADVLRITVEADGRATTQLESRYDSGLASKLDVLDARRTELRDRRAALQVQSARYIATIGLVRALGGGWAPALQSAANIN